MEIRPRSAGWRRPRPSRVRWEHAQCPVSSPLQENWLPSEVLFETDIKEDKLLKETFILRLEGPRLQASVVSGRR